MELFLKLILLVVTIVAFVGLAIIGYDHCTGEPKINRCCVCQSK